jgi:hypothetical protein
MFLVMRTHTSSHTAARVLWQVVSRPFETKQAADNWRGFCELDYLKDHPKGKHKFFVIETDFTQTLPG